MAKIFSELKNNSKLNLIDGIDNDPNKSMVKQYMKRDKIDQSNVEVNPTTVNEYYISEPSDSDNDDLMVVDNSENPTKRHKKS